MENFPIKSRMALWRSLAKLCGIRIRRVKSIPPKYLLGHFLDDVGFDGAGQISYVRKDVWDPWVAHELGHFFAASEQSRGVVNFNTPSAEEEVEAAEIGLWLCELAGYAEAEVRATADGLNTWEWGSAKEHLKAEGDFEKIRAWVESNGLSWETRGKAEKESQAGFIAYQGIKIWGMGSSPDEALRHGGGVGGCDLSVIPASKGLIDHFLLYTRSKWWTWRVYNGIAEVVV